MIPGPPRILLCPFCGEEKQVLSLLSGNTFGAECWSDLKRIAPMLPEISSVQKCPRCGKYFLVSEQHYVTSKTGCTFEQGTLTLHEMEEALAQFQSDPNKDNVDYPEREFEIRLLLFHTQNDYFYRRRADGKRFNGEENLPSEENIKSFEDNIRRLIELYPTDYDTALKAELYREIGQFGDCCHLLEQHPGFNEEEAKDILHKIYDAAKAKRKEVFIL